MCVCVYVCGKIFPGLFFENWPKNAILVSISGETLALKTKFRYFFLNLKMGWILGEGRQGVIFKICPKMQYWCQFRVKTLR